MKIKSAKFKGIFLFHDEQVLDDLSWFNLFIGPNGSGKSNCLKILSGSELKYQQNLPYGQPASSEFSCHLGDNKAFFEMQYQTRQYKFADEWDKNYVSRSERIVFKDGKLDQGNIGSFRKIFFIDKLGTDLEFYRDLIKCTRDDHDPQVDIFTLLTFCIFYVFGRHYHFGDFINENRGQVDESLLDRSYPSGVMNCAKLVTKFLLAAKGSGTVVLLDEPELHLEPRSIRKVFHFFIWFNSRRKNQDEISEGEKRIFNMVEYVRCHSHARFKFRENIGTTSGLYEPMQMFVASHSPVLINEHVRIHANIYEFQSVLKEEGSGVGIYPMHIEGRFSNTIVKESTNYENILEGLGCKGSDLLQTNGVVWVEGPSDVIYLKNWLDMYAAENNKNILLQGKDYDFQMYGGAILDSICLIRDGANEAEEHRKLVAMFSFSRNAFVIIDSDAEKQADGLVKDKSNFVVAKKFIKGQIENLRGKGKNLGLWYKDGDTDIRTLEDYLDADSKSVLPSGTKKIRALRIVEFWEERNKKLSDFPNQLSVEIKVLYEMIEQWNK